MNKMTQKPTNMSKVEKLQNMIGNVLKIMGQTESVVIQEFNKTDKSLNYLKPCWYFRWSSLIIKKINFKENGFIVKYKFVEKLDDGAYYKFYKSYIPYSYMDLSRDELIDYHYTWSENRIKKITRKLKLNKLIICH